MLFTELDEKYHGDYAYDCRKNLNNSLEYWIHFAQEYWDVELTIYEARQQRAQERAELDRSDRYHNQLRNDEPWT